MKKTGRPTKLTEKLIKFFEDKLGPPNAGFIRATCAQAGIDEKTYYNWMQRGEEGEEPYEAFFQRVRAAINEAANQASRWFWENDRKFWALSGPGKAFFTAPTQRMEVEGELDHSISILFEIIRRPDNVSENRDDKTTD